MTLQPGGAPMSIVGGLREFARATPGATAVIDGDRTLTYAALDERANRLANHLLAAGLQPGDRVARPARQPAEYLEVAAGIAKAGLVMVPLNPRLTPHEADYILDHSGARAIVLDDALAAVAADSCQRPADRSRSTATRRYDVRGGAGGRRRDRPGVAVAEQRPVLHRLHVGHDRAPEGRADLAPGRVAHLLRVARWSGASAPGARAIAVAPMYHGAGFAFGYAPVFTGGTVTMLRAWDPERAAADDRSATGPSRCSWCRPTRS